MPVPQAEHNRKTTAYRERERDYFENVLKDISVQIQRFENIRTSYLRIDFSGKKELYALFPVSEILESLWKQKLAANCNDKK